MQRQYHFWKLCRGKSSAEVTWSVQPELLSNPPWLYSFYIGTADQNWFSVVVLNLGLPVYTEFPCLKIFPLHNFQKRDCLSILAHTFGIGLLLLMKYILEWAAAVCTAIPHLSVQFVQPLADAIKHLCYRHNLSYHDLLSTACNIFWF